MTQGNRLSEAFKTAAWMGTTPVDTISGEIGISFAMGSGEIARLRVSEESAANLIESIAKYLTQPRLVIKVQVGVRALSKQEKR